MTINKMLCLVLDGAGIKLKGNEILERMASVMDKVILVLDMLSF